MEGVHSLLFRLVPDRFKRRETDLPETGWRGRFNMDTGEVNKSFTPDLESEIRKTPEIIIQPEELIKGEKGEDSSSAARPRIMIKEISVEIEEDDNVGKETQNPSYSSNFLHPQSAEKQPSRASSRLSSALSIISLASSNISSRVNMTKTKACWHSSLGCSLALISSFFMTAYTSMIKLHDEMDSMQIVVIRGVIQLVLMAIYAIYKKMSFTGPKQRSVPIFIFLVALAGGLRLLFIFTSFSRLPLGDSTTILFSSPVFVMLFSICILKERCGLFRIGAGAMLIVGVILIAQPPFIFGKDEGSEDYDYVGYIMVGIACLMSALGLVLTKKISKKVDKTVIMFYLGIASAVCGAIGLFSAGNPSNPPAWEWGLAIGISFLGLIQQYLLVFAVTLESPSRVTIIRQFQIILAYVGQVVIFKEIPDLMKLIGAGVILFTVIVSTFEKQIYNITCGRKKKQEEKAKKIAADNAEKESMEKKTNEISDLEKKVDDEDEDEDEILTEEKIIKRQESEEMFEENQLKSPDMNEGRSS